MLKAFNNFIDRLENLAMVVFMSTATIVICIQVIIRYSFNNTIFWAEEVAIYSIIAMTFVGASMGVKHSSHISVDVLNALAPPSINKVLHIISATVGIVFSFYIIYYGSYLFFNTLDRGQLSPAMRLPMAIFYFPIVLSGIFMAIRYCNLLYETFKKPPMSHAEEITASADKLV